MRSRGTFLSRGVHHRLQHGERSAFLIEHDEYVRDIRRTPASDVAAGLSRLRRPLHRARFCLIDVGDDVDEFVQRRRFARRTGF